MSAEIKHRDELDGLEQIPQELMDALKVVLDGFGFQIIDMYVPENEEFGDEAPVRGLMLATSQDYFKGMIESAKDELIAEDWDDDDDTDEEDN